MDNLVEKIIRISWFLSLSLLLSSCSFINSNNCSDVENEYKTSVTTTAQILAKSKEEWNALPKYRGNSFGEDARDPGETGGRIYSNFETFFQENYGNDWSSEKRIEFRLIINNPKCFNAREVAEAQESLDRL